MIASDGWKKKYAEDGANLMNACLLTPDGRSYFLEALNTGGDRKTAEYIADFNAQLAAKHTSNEVSQ